jgi:hypothetical protein
MNTRKPWTPDEENRAWAMREAGQSNLQIAGNLGRTKDSVANKLTDLKQNPPRQQPVTQGNQSLHHAANEMELAALREQVRRTSPPVVVRSEWDEDEPDGPNVKALWEHAEKDCDRRIERTRKQAQFSVEFDAKPIAITFVSDQHIAPGTPVAMKRMREDAELIARTPRLFAVLNGDGVDNHIKHRSAILASRSTPDDQWRLFDYYLQIFHESILVVTSGNHDAWTVGLGGTDVLRRIAEANKVRYAKHEARLSVKVGQQPYSVAMRHQYRLNSSFNQTHAVKQWFRLGEADFDIGVVSHHHECAVEKFIARGQVRVAIRPGSYQITSAYAADLGYNPSIPACPTVILFPGSRRMWTFHDVRDGAEALALVLKG